MKKRVLSWVVALCTLGVMGAGSCNNGGSSVELTIFHTNDIHSHLRAAKIDPFGLGGLAKLSTLLKGLRGKTPVSLTLDAGDYSEGTWYFSLDTGANMLKMLDAMGYDGACLGNHDFLIGPDQIITTMNKAATHFPVMAANLDMSAYPRAAELQKVLPPTTIKTVGGVKVGIIGLTTFALLYNSYLAPVAITNAVDVATKYAKQLRPNVDVLIIVSHNDYDMNTEIARSVPGVDAVISGHSHKKVPRALLVSNAGRQIPVVETGQWGTFLGDLKLSITPTGKRSPATVQFKSYELHPVTPDLAEDPSVAQLVTQQDQALNAKFGDDVVNHVVAQTDLNLIQQDGAETPLGNLAVKAYRASTGADVSFEELSLTGVSVAKGASTVMDIHDVIPHIYDPASGKEWKLRVWNAKGSDLSLLFNVFYTVDGLMPLGSPIGWLSADNAVVVWEPGATRIKPSQMGPSTRAIPAVKSITIGGKPLDPNARYKVALADGMLLSVHLANDMFHLGVDLSDIQDTGLEAWQSVIDYATKAGRLTLQDLAVGGRTHTQSPDLAVYYYAIDWDQSQLTVEVQNTGLSASQPGTLTCSTGLPNDFVSYNTEIQKWTALPAQSIPSLEPGANMSFQIPWSSNGLAKGYWPVQCAVSSPGDKYSPNDSAQKVFKL
jgi:5'-nucleotidase/UDP-sugar diphosphatase